MSDKEMQRSIIETYLSAPDVADRLTMLGPDALRKVKEALMGEPGEPQTLGDVAQAPEGDSPASRWEAFTLNELQSIYEGLLGRDRISEEEIHRDKRLREEIKQAIRTHPQQSSYRGPGIYRDFYGKDVQVVGAARYESGGVGSTVIVVDVPGPAGGLRAFDSSFFEGREDDGTRRYTYVGPLP